MKNTINKKSKKLIAIPVLCLIFLVTWYYTPKTHRGSSTFETENGEILNIQFELSSQKRFFEPEQLSGRIWVNDVEYTSIFFSESILKEYKKEISNPVINSSIDWFSTFFSQSEKKTPYFIPKEQEGVENTIFIYNLPELLSDKTPEGGDLTLLIWKNERIYKAANKS